MPLPAERTQEFLPDKMISRALGEELRRARETLGWSRASVVALLPSGIGDRTILSYEHGSRHITALRLIEICHAMGADAPQVLARGLQRARIYLEDMALIVDLHALLRDRNEIFLPMHQWARNALNENPVGIVEVEPMAVRNLALFIGCPYLDLANYLSRFVPDC